MVETVCHPDDSAGLQLCLVERRHRRHAIGQPRGRTFVAQQLSRRLCIERLGRIARHFSRRREQHVQRAALLRGFVHRIRGHAHHIAPAFRTGPAIVDHDQRAAGRAGLSIRRPCRPRKAKDRQRQRNHPQQQQPPWRPRRCFFFGLQVFQQRQRRQRKALRLRRRRPQQQPQQRQCKQAKQRPWLQEQERSQAHAATPLVKP